MILALLAAQAIANAPVVPAPAEISHAIAVGRLDEARMMIDLAAKGGVPRATLDRAIADLAFASGEDGEAVARYQLLLDTAPNDPVLLEHASIAAMRSGDIARAQAWLARAIGLPGASWRVWNAQGALADRNQNWAAADRAYARAAALAPHRAEVVSNMGWSQLLRGDWAKAVGLLEQAADLDPSSPAIADNLAFARLGLADDLPRRGEGEPVSAWAARLNDAGVAAAMRGDRARATAAFARALEISDRWNARAFANLKQLGGAQ